MEGRKKKSITANDRFGLYPCAVLKERFLYGATLEHTGVRWHIVGEPHVTTHYGVMPYPHPAQY